MRIRSARQAFTLIELLVAMALIVFIMVILSSAFATGMQTLRQLKALGDQEERLRTATIQLRRDLAAAHFDVNRLISDGLRTGVVDPEEADDLRDQYEDVRAQADDLQSALTDLYRVNTNPAAKPVFEQTIKSLQGIKETSNRMIELLDLVNPPK